MQELYEKLVDVFDFSVDLDENYCWHFDESEHSGLVDGKHILGRAVGPFFLVNGSSRNKRYYTKDLWESALRNVNEMLTNRRMLGTIGHEQELDDEAIREGKPSHLITKLWIDPKQNIGMGELLILGTPAGQNLNTYMRAKVKLPVSSRAFGKFTGEKYEDCEIVDPKTFQLRTFDFVQSPGVLKAIPVLVESNTYSVSNKEITQYITTHPCNNLHSNKNIINNVTLLDEGYTMSEPNVMLESLISDKRFAEEKMNEAVRSANTLQTTVDALKAQVTSLQEELQNYRACGTVDAIQETFQASKKLMETKKMDDAEVTAMLERLDRYTELGTPQELSQMIEDANNIADVYEALGSPPELAETLETSYKTLKMYNKLGTPAQIQATMETMQATMDELQSIATLPQIKEAFSLLESYLDIGTVEEIQESLQTSQKFASLVTENYKQKRAKKLSEKYHVKKEDVTKMLENMSYDTVKSVLSKMAESVKPTPKEQIVNRYSLSNTRPNTSKKNENVSSLRRRNQEDSGNPLDESVMDGSMRDNRASRLFSNYKLKTPIVVSGNEYSHSR